METLTRTLLDWHVASAPFEDDGETGDTGFVYEHGDSALAVAIDALGHGPNAARVAEVAKLHIGGMLDASLESIIQSCHGVLRGTRGAAVCLARLDGARNVLDWLSVGNVQGMHISVDANGLPEFESLIMRGGVVGDRLPELRTSSIGIRRGDVLVLASDGIRFGWHAEFRPGMPPDVLAETLLARHGHGGDDAMALTIRYNGLKTGSDR